MYRLHTTPAFVLGHAQSGESSRVFWLLTRDLGLIAARSQGVRELRNRNRYALAVGAHAHVTVVRGRESWRLTTASADPMPRVHAAIRRTFPLLRELVPGDDTAGVLYDELYLVLRDGTPDPYFAEALVLLRALERLGYVDPHADPRIAAYFDRTLHSSELVSLYSADRRPLVRAVNLSLRAARGV